jgi:hypothetical protein
VGKKGKKKKKEKVPVNWNEGVVDAFMVIGNIGFPEMSYD